MADEDDKKDVKNDNSISLKVVTQEQNEIYFKCKKTTALSKLMNAFCQRQGVSLQAFDAIDPVSVEEKAHRMQRDPLTLTESIHQLGKRRCLLTFEVYLVLLLSYHLQTDAVIVLHVLLVIFVRHRKLQVEIAQ
eukprot:CAMPEP_0182829760 /NCGR_PEP_ID=MMETSP0006_2-20121128/18210_1 /TAXON_ID=97485 /ORGANISM="Prymnesium parvum, Strain Texoma1" /LENGTH=133 /DNA_ID=CAMNT_0024957275 /DNA_START=520 /DNA_END=922 /DNA_ORIENTATION=-